MIDHVVRQRDLPPQLTGGPFRLADAVALGVSRHVLAGQRFRQVIRGVYVLAERPNSVQSWLDAVRLVLPDAVGSHTTAADLRGLPTPKLDELVHVTVPPPREYPRISGVRVHVAPIGTDLRQVHGRPVLSVERTLLDLAGAGVSLVDLVIFGDAAVRRGWTTHQHLVAFTDQATGRGVRTARRAAGRVRDRVDSAMETRLRLLLVLAGLPTPAVNEPVNDMSGWLATPDLSYPSVKIAIEYDGDHHRHDRRQWTSDKQRRRLLRDLGWALLECVADDVLRRPEQTLAWTHRKLLAAGYPGVPRTRSDRWRPHWT